MSVGHSASQWIQRQMFSGMGGVLGAGARIEIYETLELLLSNQVLLSTALREIYKIESKDGKKKDEVRAIVVYDCMTALESGRNLSDALEKWVPEQEIHLIRAGERSGDMVNALKDVVRIVTAKGKIVAAVAKGATYPVILLFMISILLNQIANKMVPQFARILPVEKWTGPAALLKIIADFVTNYGMTSIIGGIVLATWVGWSLPNMYKSPIRKYLDMVPPWSIYRMLNGSTFLLNVAVMLKAGIRVQEALIILSKGGSPWLRHRIQATIQNINQGANLGLALHRTGYNFPDARAVQFLRVLSNQDGFDEKLTNFGDRWLDKSVSGIEAASGILLAVGILTTGVLILLILGGVMSIQQLAQQGMK